MKYDVRCLIQSTATRKGFLAFDEPCRRLTTTIWSLELDYELGLYPLSLAN